MHTFPLKEHFDECPFVLTNCKCGENVIREDINTHVLSCRLNIDEVFINHHYLDSPSLSLYRDLIQEVWAMILCKDYLPVNILTVYSL